MIALSGVRSMEDVLELKSFLTQQSQEKMKIVSKIETPEALENIDSINKVSDSLIIVFDEIQDTMEKKGISQEDLIKKIKSTGKPVSISFK